MNLFEFYPTPQSLIDKMLENIDFKAIHTILEPSAGTGNICEAVNRKLKYANNMYSNDNYRGDIDCVEIDEDLRGVLKNKDYRVVHDDFLEYQSKKKYDLIIMNPPFSAGDKHLMKAIELQEQYGGNIVCILNAETLRNAYSNIRKTLVRRLDEYEASIEYMTGEFENAERKTSVEIALIKIVIPEKENSIIIEHLEKAKSQREYDFTEPSALVQGDFIQAIIDQYNFEINAGVNLIQEYLKISPYILRNLSKEKEYNDQILELKIRGGKDYKADITLINDYIKKVRVKYWRTLFEKPEFVRNLTTNLRNELMSRVDDLEEYEFSYHNIMEMRIELNQKTIQSVEDTIINLFDELSHKHSYIDETSKNIYLFNGWKTNTAHKINKKVIIPMYGVVNQWNNRFEYRYDVRSKLEDIEKSLAFLDGGETPDISIEAQLSEADKSQISKDIELKYFKVTFYKKGTCHITFTNERLLEKFNIFGCQRKGWLPPSYGKKRKTEMTNEEKTVVDSFGGNYDEVLKNAEYYIVKSGQSLLSAGKADDADETPGQSDDYEATEEPLKFEIFEQLTIPIAT